MTTPTGGNFNAGTKFEDGYKSGLEVSVASTTTLGIATGSAIDSTNSSNATLSSALTINTAVVGANGIDTGTLGASKIYAVYLVWKSLDSTVTPVGLVSLSATAPTLPTGYDSFRRIGWAFTDGSSLFRTLYAYGKGRDVLYTFDTPVIVVTAGNATTATAVSLENLVPAINKIPVILECALTPGAAGRALTIYPSGSAGTSQNIVLGQVTSVVIRAQLMTNALLISGIPSFDYKVANSGDAASIYIAGFRDSV